jgi:hypothetical protein
MGAYVSFTIPGGGGDLRAEANTDDYGLFSLSLDASGGPELRGGDTGQMTVSYHGGSASIKARVYCPSSDGEAPPYDSYVLTETGFGVFSLSYD